MSKRQPINLIWHAVFFVNFENKCLDYAYLFDKYSFAYEDPERDEWEEKLSFLGIKFAEAIPGVRDKYLNVYVSFEEKNAPVTGPTVDNYNFRIQNNLKFGMGQEELYSYIQEPSYRSGDDRQWRYDWITVHGNAYSGETGDLSGLQNGDVEIQLFVYWDNQGVIDHYEVWYADRNSTDREVHHYTVDSEGRSESKVSNPEND